MKRDEVAGGGRGWREMAGVSGEEPLVKRGEEERLVGESERAGLRGEEEVAAEKVLVRKEGEREGLARSFCMEETRGGCGGGAEGVQWGEMGSM